MIITNTGFIDLVSFVDNAGIGSVAWGSPGNAHVSDDAKASVTLSGPGGPVTTHRLVATGLSAKLPSHVWVLGIIARVELMSFDNNSPEKEVEFEVELFSGGVPIGQNKSNGVTPPAADTYREYGGSSDLWGLTNVFGNYVNSAGFGFFVSYFVSNRNDAVVSVDHMQMNVYYSPTLPTIAKKFFI